MRIWWPQWVQTSWLASQSRMNSICSHLGHFSQRFSGADLRETSARSLGRTKLVSQFMGGGMARMTRSAPEGAEGRYEVLRFLHLAEQPALLVVGTHPLCRSRLEIGDDGGLPGRLVGGHGQDVLLAK